jgi:hypothetical protein
MTLKTLFFTLQLPGDSKRSCVIQADAKTMFIVGAYGGRLRFLRAGSIHFDIVKVSNASR